MKILIILVLVLILVQTQAKASTKQGTTAKPTKTQAPGKASKRSKKQNAAIVDAPAQPQPIVSLADPAPSKTTSKSGAQESAPTPGQQLKAQLQEQRAQLNSLFVQMQTYLLNQELGQQSVPNEQSLAEQVRRLTLIVEQLETKIYLILGVGVAILVAVLFLGYCCCCGGRGRSEKEKQKEKEKNKD